MARNARRALVAIGCAVVVTACGGGSDSSKSAKPKDPPKPSKKAIEQAGSDLLMISQAAERSRDSENANVYDLDLENVGAEVAKDDSVVVAAKEFPDYATFNEKPVSLDDLDKLKEKNSYIVSDDGDYQLVIIEPMGDDWYMVWREGTTGTYRVMPNTLEGDLGPFRGDELKGLMTKPLADVDCKVTGTAPGC